MVDIRPCVLSCDEALVDFETNPTMSVQKTCILAMLVARTTKTVHGHREGKEEMCHANGLGAVKDKCEA